MGTKNDPGAFAQENQALRAEVQRLGVLLDQAADALEKTRIVLAALSNQQYLGPDAAILDDQAHALVAAIRNGVDEQRCAECSALVGHYHATYCSRFATNRIVNDALTDAQVSKKPKPVERNRK